MADAPSFEASPRWLSILVPAYKAEAHLHACVSSVVGQGVAGVEVIVLDKTGRNGADPDCPGVGAFGAGKVHPAWASVHAAFVVGAAAVGGGADAKFGL